MGAHLVPSFGHPPEGGFSQPLTPREELTPLTWAAGTCAACAAATAGGSRGGAPPPAAAAPPPAPPASAARISSASAGLGRYPTAPRRVASTAVAMLP